MKKPVFEIIAFLLLVTGLFGQEEQSNILVKIDQGTPEKKAIPEIKVPGKPYVPGKEAVPAVPPKTAAESIREAELLLQTFSQSKRPSGTIVLEGATTDPGQDGVYILHDTLRLGARTSIEGKTRMKRDRSVRIVASENFPLGKPLVSWDASDGFNWNGNFWTFCRNIEFDGRNRASGVEFGNGQIGGVEYCGFKNFQNFGLRLRKATRTCTLNGLDFHDCPIGIWFDQTRGVTTTGCLSFVRSTDCCFLLDACQDTHIGLSSSENSNQIIRAVNNPRTLVASLLVIQTASGNEPIFDLTGCRGIQLTASIRKTAKYPHFKDVNENDVTIDEFNTSSQTPRMISIKREVYEK